MGIIEFAVRNVTESQYRPTDLLGLLHMDVAHGNLNEESGGLSLIAHIGLQTLN